MFDLDPGRFKVLAISIVQRSTVVNFILDVLGFANFILTPVYTGTILESRLILFMALSLS